MLSCLRTEFRKLLYLPYILPPVAGILILCLSATGATAADGTEISIFSLMISSADAGYRESIEGSALWLWKQGIGSWLIVFLPLLLSFGYLTQFSSERRNGQLLFQLVRSGNVRWCTAKILSGALFGGFLFLAAYALFGLLMTAAFPAFASFPAEEQSFYLEWYFGGSAVLYVARRLLGAFLYGIFGSIFGIGIAVLFRDKYMLLCLPFLMNYACRQIILRLEMDAWSAGTESTPLLEALLPDNILNVAANPCWALTAALMLSAYAGLLILFCLRIKTTPKCGFPSVCSCTRPARDTSAAKPARRIRTIRHISSAEFMQWMRSSRLVILGVMLVFIHMQVIRPLKDCAVLMNEPVSFFEPFVALGNSGLIAMVVPALFLVLTADFPQKNGIDLFYQIRCSKKTWVLGQILFAAKAAVFLVAFLLASSVLMITGSASWQTDFSPAVTHYLAVFPERTADYVVQLLPANLYQQMKLPGAVLHTALLMGLYFFLLALVLLLSALYSRKTAGILADAFLIIMGTIFCAADVRTKWLFPMAHTILWIHFAEYLREQVFPLKTSYLYMVLCCAGLFACCLAAAGQYEAGKELE